MSEIRYLTDMRRDAYFPPFLVDKLEAVLIELNGYLAQGGHSENDMQDYFDRMTENINDLSEQFEEAGSEIETAARDDIADTVMQILAAHNIAWDIELVLRMRDW